MKNPAKLTDKAAYEKAIAAAKKAGLSREQTSKMLLALKKKRNTEKQARRDEGLPIGTKGRVAPTPGGGFVRGTAKPLARLGQQVVQTVAPRTPDANSDFLGKVENLNIDVTKSPLQKDNLRQIRRMAGTGVEIASLIAGGTASPIKSLARQGVKKTLPKLGRLAAKESGAGAIAGAGSELSQDKTSAKKVLAGAAIGSVAAPALAVGVPLSGFMAREASSKMSKGLLNLSREAGSQSLKAKSFFSEVPESVILKQQNKLEKNYTELFESTIRAAKLLDKEVRFNRNTPQFLAKNNVVLPVKKGKIQVDEPIRQIKDLVEPLNEIMTGILDNSTNAYRVSEVMDQVVKSMDTKANRASGELSKKEAEVARFFTEIQKRFGEDIDAGDLSKIKSRQWKQSSVFDSTKSQAERDVAFDIAKTLQKIIEDTHEDKVIKELNSLIGDHYSAANFLEKNRGKTVNGGRLSGNFARVIGGMAGAKLGIAGAFAGQEVGGRLADMAISNSLSNPLRNMILSQAEQRSPEILKKAKYLLARMEARDTILKLPEAEGLTEKGVTKASRVIGTGQINIPEEGFEKALLGKQTPGERNTQPSSTKYKDAVENARFQDMAREQMSRLFEQDENRLLPAGPGKRTSGVEVSINLPKNTTQPTFGKQANRVVKMDENGTEYLVVTDNIKRRLSQLSRAYDNAAEFVDDVMDEWSETYPGKTEFREQDIADIWEGTKRL